LRIISGLININAHHININAKYLLAWPRTTPRDVTKPEVFSASQTHVANSYSKVEHGFAPDFLTERHSLANVGMVVISKVGSADPDKACLLTPHHRWRIQSCQSKDHSIVAPGTKGTTSTCITKGTTSTRGAAIFISSGMSGAGHVARNDICFSFTKPTDEAANWPRVLKVGQCQPCIPGTNLPELASALFFFKTHKVVRFHLGGGLPSLFGI